MSAKSAGQPEVHTKGLVSKRTVLIAVIIVLAVFITIITYYPLVFNSQNSSQKAPATEVN